MKLRDVIRILEQIAPPEYACPDDPIGLHIGDPNQDVRRVIVALDATPAVIGAAKQRSADLIVTHHPLIYRPLTNVRLDTYPQSLIYQLVHSDIALYAMHTNLDCADGGINDILAERLGVVETKVLEPIHATKMFKLTVFVPTASLEFVREAIFEAYPGEIGNYTDCSFAAPGIGTYRPGPGAEPYIGKIGELEQTPEMRLEVLVPEKNLHDVIAAIRTAHPYEEVAYDVFPLLSKEGLGEIPLHSKRTVHGIGRYGKLLKEMSFDGFCEMVRDVLDVDDVRISGDPELRVETVAMVGGSGGSLVGLAHSVGADVLVTGDVPHHEFLHAKALGLNLIDATHGATERPGMIALAPRLHDLLSSQDVTVEYIDDVLLGM
jgi:dinuclear metal center YbgI/SA1388 family protein